jgi:hypothetical protein
MWDVGVFVVPRGDEELLRGSKVIQNQGVCHIGYRPSTEAVPPLKVTLL